MQRTAARQGDWTRWPRPWRFLGFLRVILTNQRLLVYAEDQYQWLSFWHSGLQEYRQRADFGLELLYPDCAPVLLRGPMVPWVSVALASCVSGCK
jgi:hypothetical protein